MTTYEKAKAYDEALERAKGFIENGDETERTIAESIFAGIMEEPDDESIKKALVHLISEQDGFLTAINGISVKNILAWLEKQGEQKPTDKVEPKFKVGDWVVYETDEWREVLQIENIELGRYIFTNGSSSSFAEEQNMRLWTIEDAKDGDVLYLQKDGKEHIIIYKGVIKERFRTFVSAYCAYNGIVNAFCFADVSRYVDIAYGGIMPATKEQRDLLFSKMKEAGYEWDAEKKELKKIEQKPAWSEDDEYNVAFIVELLLGQDSFDKEYLNQCKKAARWLKSIKDRVQPQPKQEWSEEDENAIVVIQDIIRYSDKIGANIYTNEVKEKLFSWLKSLKPQNTWKPSEEMLEALYRVTPENVMEKSEDEMLLDKLYQGLKYGKVLSEK